MISASMAAFWTSRPALVLPVKAIRTMPGARASRSPISRPSPLTMLSTPGGRPARSEMGPSSCVDGEID